MLNVRLTTAKQARQSEREYCESCQQPVVLGGHPEAAEGRSRRSPVRDARTTGLAKLPRSERVISICDAVIDITSALFSVSSKDLRNPRRSTADIARVRQIAMYVAHVTLALSMRDVGHGFGRDRTTVLYACHQIEDMRDDLEFDRIVSITERVIAAAFGLTEGRGDEVI